MRQRPFLLLAGAALIASSCILVSSCVFVVADGHDEDDDHDARRHSYASARATIEAKSGSHLEGNAVFTERNGGVLVEITLESAPPGMHAVHVHDVGDCSADDGTSAGGHFNPADVAHGSPHVAEHHAGDLGNMWVGENGRGYHAIFMPGLTVSAGEFSVNGRGIIVHAGVDDLVSQPTGAAGGRIGCGVIRLAH